MLHSKTTHPCWLLLVCLLQTTHAKRQSESESSSRSICELSLTSRFNSHHLLHDQVATLHNNVLITLLLKFVYPRTDLWLVLYENLIAIAGPQIQKEQHTEQGTSVMQVDLIPCCLHRVPLSTSSYMCWILSFALPASGCHSHDMFATLAGKCTRSI